MQGLGLREQIVRTRNVLTPLLWLNLITGGMTATAFTTGAAEAGWVLLWTFVGSTVFSGIAYTFFALRRPEMLLSEDTQVRTMLAQTFGQSSQSGRDAVALVDAIRREPSFSERTNNKRAVIEHAPARNERAGEQP